MEVNVSGRNTTVSESLRRQANEKISHLDRIIGDMDRAEVHFWEEKNPRIGPDKEFCEVTMEGHGHHIRTKVSAPDGFTAIDLAVDKLERQLRKLKTKVQKRHKNRQKPEIDEGLVPESLIHSDDEVEPIYSIVKTKQFTVTEMAADEAALQMDLLNHDFYVFRNVDTGLGAVVYRREDGDIGLINVN